MNNKRILSFFLGLLVFSASAESRKIHSTGYDHSVEKLTKSMIVLFSYNPDIYDISESCIGSKEKLFETMYDLTCEYLDNGIGNNNQEIFELQTSWQLNKIYKTMDFSEYLLTQCSPRVLLEIVDYGQKKKIDIEKLMMEKSIAEFVQSKR